MTRPGADCLPLGLTEPPDTADDQVSQEVTDHEPDRTALARECAQAFPAVPSQVRQARRFLAAVLAGCPAADEAILCLSELASNCVLHSASRLPGGQFTVRVQVGEGSYVRIELHDSGGPWTAHPDGDGRPHGLDIVRSLAADSGVRGDALTGWISWATLDWSANGRPDQATP